MSEKSELVPPEVSFVLVMLCPDEQDFARASKCVEFETLEESLRTTEDAACQVSMDAKVLTEMLNNARSRDALYKQLNLNLAYTHGRISGLVVNFVLAANSYPETRQYASITCAARFVHRCNLRSRGFGIENIQQKIWPKFKPVANLWAALQIFGNDKGNIRNLQSAANFGTVMECAVEILGLAANCHLFHTRNTLLDCSTSLLGKYRVIGRNLAYERIPEEILKLAAPEPR